MKNYPLIITTLGLSILFASPMVEARHFKVYGWNTPKAGEVELVYWSDYVARSNRTMNYFGKSGVDREGLWGHTLEVEYGITDRWTVAAYADFEQPNGEDFKYIQSRVVAMRYRFGEKAARFFDTALYVEYYLPDVDYRGEKKEKIEARIILEKDFGKTNLRLNPKFEKVVSGPDVDEGIEFEYGASLYRNISPRTKLGLELYGSLGELTSIKPSDEQKHYLVPALKYKLTDHLGWNLGAAFGLTDASDDLVLKSILEWEL